MAGRVVTLSGRFRGQPMRVALPQPASVTVRYSLAGIEDFKRSIERVVEAAARVGEQLAAVRAGFAKATDTRLARQAFIADGGDPALVERLEVAFGVTHDS